MEENVAEHASLLSVNQHASLKCFPDLRWRLSAKTVRLREDMRFHRMETPEPPCGCDHAVNQ